MNKNVQTPEDRNVAEIDGKVDLEGELKIQAESTHRHRPPRYRKRLSVFFLCLWLILYGAGILVETIEYRYVLMPNAIAEQLEKSNSKLLEKLKSKTEKPSKLKSLIVVFPCFTPTNLALLALLAALIGGCMSNVVASSLEDDVKAKLSARQLGFMSEHPVAAMLRGFIVYLCVVGGLYLATEDPFRDSTQGQYARLAGMLSVVAFLVGYDPSRIEAWLNLAPTPGKLNRDIASVKLTDKRTRELSLERSNGTGAEPRRKKRSNKSSGQDVERLPHK